MTTRLAGSLIFIIVVTIFGSYLGVLLYLTWPISEFSVAKSGVFGDSFGAVNALFSGLAFAALIVTILLQRDEMHLTRIAFERQQFEESFFNLIGLYAKNLGDIRISLESENKPYQGVDALAFLVKKLRESVQQYSLHVQNDEGRKIYEQEIFNNAKSVLINQSRYLSTLQYLLSLIYRSVTNENERDKYILLVTSQMTTVELKYLFYRCLVLPTNHELVNLVNQSKPLLTGFANSIVSKTDRALYERIHTVKFSTISTQTKPPYTTKMIRKLKRKLSMSRRS